jgi:hypothetical protein
VSEPTLPAVPVFVGAPEALSAKVRWVLDCLGPAAGVRPAVVTDPDRAAGCVLAYAQRPIAGVPTIPSTLEAEELVAARQPLPAESFRTVAIDAAPSAEGVGSGSLVGAFPAQDAGFAVPFDLVMSAFVLLACWDELSRPERDRHGRFPYSASLFADNEALRLDEPVCDAYAVWLRTVLIERCAALGLPGPAPVPRFLVALTHDVDGLRRWTARGWLAWARRLVQALGRRRWAALRFELGAAAHHLRHDLPQGRDPAYTFPELIAGEDALGVSSSFYVIASHQHRTDGNQPATYRRRRPELLKLLAAADREVGLHGNHRDSIDAVSLRADRASLAAASGGRIGGIRYHYLKCLYHTSLPLVEQAGFAYDTSLAFAEQEGFRCGFSHPFRPWDMAYDRPLDIVELPLAVMDSTLQERHYRHLSADEARRATLTVLERMRASGGAAAILWHHNRFHPYVGRGYGDAYWEIVRWVQQNGGECLPAAEVVRRWTARCASRDEWITEAATVTSIAAPDAAGGSPGSLVPETAAGRPDGEPPGADPMAPAPRSGWRTGSGEPERGEERARVVHVSVVHRPDDPRIFERECRSLADAGYEVTYLAPGAGSGFASGVHLGELPRRSRRTRWLSAAPLLGELHRLRPDVVHVHDPELLTLFPALRPLVGSLVYDMHEYVAQAVEGKYYIPRRVRPVAARATVGGQRSLVSLADGVVAVVDEQFEQLGARPDLRATLPNYPRFARFRDAQPQPGMVAEQRLKLIYIGSLTRTRGVDVMLDVLRQVDGAVLYLGGTFSNPDFEAEVRATADGDLAGRLTLLGRVPPDDVPDLLAGADVVWVPALQTAQYARPTVATKLYEGMAVGLAVLVSDLPGRGDVVREVGCGVAVEPGVAGHLAGVRTLLDTDREALSEMGARARAAVEARYSWEAIEGRLVDFYAELLERRCRALRASREP